MREQLDKLETVRKTGGNRLFYLATPPNAFLPISKELGRTGMLAENGAWRRLVVEKPFGTDLASANALNSELLKLVDEHQIYRIDHYLGKETVQNILVLRFANGMFEPIWNRNHIDHIQITVDETARRRASRQLLRRDRRVARHGAEPSVPAAVAGRDGAADEVRRRIRCAREKAKVLAAIQTQSEQEALHNSVRGQYRAGKIGDAEIERLSQDRRRRARQHHRDLCRAEADHRQLALGRRAVLPAHRQGARRQAHRDRHQVQAGAVRDVPRHAGGPAVAELPDHLDRADRGHRAAVQHQGAGADHSTSTASR